MHPAIQTEASSFRDPSGFIFRYKDTLYRNIDQRYADDFNFLNSSFLLSKLSAQQLLIDHQEVELPEISIPGSLRIIRPKMIDVITYPVEWSFSQLKDAALLTLKIMKVSLEHGMVLKDASAFNVQFVGSKPVFIDTLSFTKYTEGSPWIAYRQFCEHFLTPLSLSSTLGVWFQSLLKVGVDGIPLPVASQLLPWHSWFKPAVLFHIHLHAKSIKHYAEQGDKLKGAVRKVSKQNLVAFIDHLSGYITGLNLKKSDRTQWQDYDQQTHYSGQSWQSKTSIIQDFANRVNPKVIWDVGGNDGYFSRSLSVKNRVVVSMDADPLAIEKNYLQAKKESLTNVYSIVADFVNPLPNMGWANSERKKLTARSSPDLIVALALIHHIAITYNVNFKLVSQYLSSITNWLVIEFVPRNDKKILPLPNTAGKESYTRENFEEAFFHDFVLIEERRIEDSERSILLLKKKN